MALKHLKTLDGSSPLEVKTDAIDNCLIPACTLRDSSGITKVQCNVVFREDSFIETIRQRMRVIMTHSGFDAVIVVLILLNTIVLAVYHHGIDAKFRHVLDNINLVSNCLHELAFRHWFKTARAHVSDISSEGVCCKICHFLLCILS